MAIQIFRNPDGADSAAPPKLAETYTAGEDIAGNDAVYIDESTGKVFKADAGPSTPVNQSEAFGIAQADALAEADVVVTFLGLQDGFSGLTIGKFLFLSESPGLLTDTAPILDDSVVVRIGRADKTDRIMVKPEIIAVLDTD